MVALVVEGLADVAASSMVWNFDVNLREPAVVGVCVVLGAAGADKVQEPNSHLEDNKRNQGEGMEDNQTACSVEGKGNEQEFQEGAPDQNQEGSFEEEGPCWLDPVVP